MTVGNNAFHCCLVNFSASSANIEQHTEMGHLSAATSVVYDNINNIVPVSKDIKCSTMNNNNNHHNGSLANGKVNNVDECVINNNNNNNADKLNNNNHCENGKIEKKMENGKVHSEIKGEPEEYNYFGFKVGAKLKWPNIIGIIIIHSLFVYVFFDGRQKPRNVWTYAWGK